MRVLSGIQPTARPHWGNYFGAIRQYVDLQHGNEAHYFIANLHALTTVRDRDNLSRWTFDAALDLLALGVDPTQAIVFIQSDVPEVVQLYWLLMSGASMGLLERCHAYKDKKARGLPANAGLFSYPVLMAADILAYDSEVVPVGEDQVQHIEVCRDLAGGFNETFGNVFVLPKPKLLEKTQKVIGIDGAKMSKSYNNAIALFEEPKVMRKQIMRIKTDSRAPEEAKEPAGDTLFELYSLFASEEERQQMAEKYRRGGFGYGEIKIALAEAAERFFAPARERREALVRDPSYVRDVLADGARRARLKAREVLERAERACGLRT
jgi:tryptophanyl-tRNA synthetase